MPDAEDTPTMQSPISRPVTRHPADAHPMRTLFTLTGARSRRASSWDRSGGNWDFVVVAPGQTAVLLEHEGPAA